MYPKKTIDSLIERAQSRQRKNSVVKKDPISPPKSPSDADVMKSLQEVTQISLSAETPSFPPSLAGTTEVVLTKIWSDISSSLTPDVLNVFLFIPSA